MASIVLSCHRGFTLFACFLLLLLHFASVAASADASDAAIAAVNDMKSLLSFKRCISRDPYSILQDWRTDSAHACNFTGIECSSAGRVISLNLSSHALQGSISAAIANLSKVLDLSNNSMSGFIPPQAGKLSQLEHLDLAYNMLQGPIPPQLGNLSCLHFFSVAVNSLNGTIPESLAQLTQMTELVLHENNLNGTIPAFLGNLTHLNILHLYRNSLVGPIPESFAHLKHMTQLDLSFNHLSGPVPPSLGQLTTLELLNLSQNHVDGCIPHQLGNLSSLKVLDLSDNFLQGTLPASIGRLNKLQVLNLSKNSLRRSIPKSMANLTSLTELDLNFNRMQGTLPAWISTFPKLKYLWLSANQFKGAIPDSWMNTSSLIQLTMSLNSLQGPLPNWLGNLSHLEWLDLSFNNFTSKGTRSDQVIPILKALLNCRRLRVLGMGYIYLQGILPSNLGAFWPNLEELSLKGNIIYGKVPCSIGNLSSVFALALGRNLLDGNIPSQIGNMSSIQYIHLGGNKLQGNIPSKLARASATLAYLFLQDNDLSGPVSGTVGELANLRKLNLSMNSFWGKIPTELGKCRLLEHLDLSANNLSGEIPPEEVAGLKYIVFGFNLSRNALTGRVPQEIGGMQMAQYIDLSSNHLSGNIGIHIEEWLTAVNLNLSFNNFTGNLSDKIGYKLTQLQTIDLSCNSFIGAVPDSLSNLSYLRFLNFSYNNFQGHVPCRQGIFKNLSKWSFIGNPLLCGGCFGLMLCNIPKHHHTSHKLSLLKVLLISITSMCGVLLVGLSIWILFKKWNSFKSTFFLTSKLQNPFMKLSMEELQRATQCFSTANLIGQGRYGKVYYGALSQGQPVAIKVFLPLNENRSQTSFRKECQVLGKLRHRNLIKILTVVYSADFKAIIMPYMSNGSLHSILYGQVEGQFISLCLQMRLRILKELAGALSYLHHDCSPPVIHCDVKPHNVLLDEDMTVKLSDFGIAQVVAQPTEAPTSSSSYAIQGTIGYVAPEYGIGGEVSIKGDVYSFGVVILEVMTRTEPTNEMFGPHLALPDWVSSVFQTNIEEEKIERIKHILRKVNDSNEGNEIQKEKDLEAVEGMLRVALSCTSKDVALRPSMKEVESILSMIHDSYTSLSPTIDIENQLRLPFNNLDEVVTKVETQPPLNKYGKAEIQEVSSSTS